MRDTSVRAAPAAVILAAGLGARLRAVHAGLPKGFVPIGGEPIIARSVRALRQAGVTELVLVVGWLEDAYREWCAREHPDARCVSNPEYASTGSLRSLLRGAAAVPGADLLVVESDLLYERRALDLLLAAPSPDTILISGPTDSGDEVWVYDDEEGRLQRMTKTPTRERAPAGELVGLSRLSAATVRALSRAAAELPASAHYEDGLNAARAERPIDLLKVDDLAWCEIDDPAHLERATARVWPAIRERDARAEAGR